jgi:pimeloyl-ACP methyl ester carboxylesterase
MRRRSRPNPVAEARGVPSGQGSRKVVFGKAGHYPFLEHADKFNSLVLEFLNSPW